MAVPRKAGQLRSADPGTLAASRRRADPGQASFIACLPFPLIDADATLPLALARRVQPALCGAASFSRANIELKTLLLVKTCRRILHCH
jgi:hypothetical protein